MSSTTPLPTSSLANKIPTLLALSSTFLLAGQTLTLSTFLIPRLLESPTTLMLKQWNSMFQTGKLQGPLLALIGTGCWWTLAYRSYTSAFNHVGGGITGGGGKVGKYITAGVLVLGIVPYTLLFLKGTNDKLLSKVEEVESQTKEEEEISIEGSGTGEESAHQLVDRWGILNVGRGLMVIAGGVLGTWTVLS